MLHRAAVRKNCTITSTVGEVSYASTGTEHIRACIIIASHTNRSSSASGQCEARCFLCGSCPNSTAFAAGKQQLLREPQTGVGEGPCAHKLQVQAASDRASGRCIVPAKLRGGQAWACIRYLELSETALSACYRPAQAAVTSTFAFSGAPTLSSAPQPWLPFFFPGRPSRNQVFRRGTVDRAVVSLTILLLPSSPTQAILLHLLPPHPSNISNCTGAWHRQLG